MTLEKIEEFINELDRVKKEVNKKNKTKFISKMCLYCVSEIPHDIYFGTREELAEYMYKNQTHPKSVHIIEYVGSVFGRNDVIREIYPNAAQLILVACDEDGYGIYNPQRSEELGFYAWEFNYGSIREKYSAFRERGIVFEDDIYARIDAFNERIMKLMKENFFRHN